MSAHKENAELILEKNAICKENVNIGISFSQKRLKVASFLEDVKKKEKEDLIKEEPEADSDSDEESEDEDEATLWDNHPAEENDSDDELEVVCRPAERTLTKTNRSQPYTVPTPDYNRTFLSIISQAAQEHMNDDAILHTLKSLVAPILQIPNKQQQLYRSLCIAETDGDLTGVTLLEFVTILNFPKVTTYLVKFIFKECFTHPADALPFFRHKDGEGNTLIHDVVAAKGVAAITSLRVLMNVRYQRETCFVFEPTAVNKKGQHPLHLTMNNPVFQKEVFDVFNRLGMGILKCVDQAGNNLLHYALINHDGICKGISNTLDKASHMADYLQAMLSFDDIKECVSKRNSNGQTPSDLLCSLDNIEDPVRQRIRDQLSKVSFRRMMSEVDVISANLPADAVLDSANLPADAMLDSANLRADAVLDQPQLNNAVLDQPQPHNAVFHQPQPHNALLDQSELEAVLQENGININNENEAADLQQMPLLQNLFPATNQVNVIAEEILIGWACTYIHDLNCSATFLTKEEKDAHMREVHNAFDESDGFGAIHVDLMGLGNGDDFLI